MFQHTIFLCDFQYWDILLIFIHKLQNLSTETTRNLWKSGIDSWTDRGTGQMREFKYGMLDLWSCHTCHDINTNQLSICTCIVPIAKIFHIVWHNSCTLYVITYDDTFLFAQSKLFIWQGMDLNIISITNNRLEMTADGLNSWTSHRDFCKVHVHIWNGSSEFNPFLSTHKFNSELHV